MLEVGFLNIGFIFLTIVEVLYFYWVVGKNRAFLLIISAWLAFQAFLVYAGFYQNMEAMPPRVVFVLLPALIAAFIFGVTKYGRAFRANVNLHRLHYIHIVRIFVEVFFLYGLYQYGYLAKEVTFEGNNFDVIPGLTAPLIALLVWQWKVIPKAIALYWNIAAMCVLFFTFSQFLLSAPSPFQKFSLDQPTVAPFYFPFIWLPAAVAPLVIFSHFISIKLLMGERVDA